MSLTNVFANALRFHRETAGISQEDLAAKADIDRTYISQLERGLKSPTLTTIQKLAGVLGIQPHLFLMPPREVRGPRVPKDYRIRGTERLLIRRRGGTAPISADVILAAVNVTHDLIDSIYAVDIDIADVLGMRNLSAFIGELLASAIIKTSGGLFEPNPHQDGYPDLLLMDDPGRAAWSTLRDRMNEKAPFSPFATGGVEIKATCGSIGTPAVFRRRGMTRPDLGDTRITSMAGYDWKAHHRDTNNLLGLLWDFVDRRPRVAALFYANNLTNADWGAIVQPRDGGGRTTSVSIMARSGIRKMYDGWLCVLAEGGYAEFLNEKNDSDQIPTG